MKKKQLKLQLVLISIGLILFAITYLYYPTISEKKLTETPIITEDTKKATDNEKYTHFENIEYGGMYDLDKPFKVKAKKAYIINEEPDIVYMDNMHVILNLTDGRIIEITSLKGRYNKENYNCFFEQDVVVTDGNTKITAINLDLLATESFAEVYNDVYLNNATGSLWADKIDYNFETKHFNVSMFNEESVKMKVLR